MSTHPRDSTFPVRHTAELHKGRVSLCEATYFLTCCAVRPTSRLTNTVVASEISETIEKLVHVGDIRPICFTIMPDHIHALVILTGKLRIGQVVGKFKAITRTGLASAGSRWQQDFYDHRLRPDEQAGSFARYIFLNPYRAGLIARNQLWAHWRIWPDVELDFLDQLKKDRYPPAEWLDADLVELELSAESVGAD